MLVKFNNDSDVRLASSCIKLNDDETYYIIFLKDVPNLGTEYSEVKNFDSLPKEIKTFVKKVYGT
jgi:hypothetical protein